MNGQNKLEWERLVFSNDGLIFVIRDHYETFAEIIGEKN